MKLGVQLYNFRDALGADFKAALKEIAKLGFAGVEFTSSHGPFSPDELAAYLKELKLECAGTMFSADAIRNPGSEAYAYARALKTPAVTHSCMAPDFKAEYPVILKGIADSGAAAAQNGFVFSYHNHWREFTDIDGISAMERILSETDPEKVFMEPDVCWITKGGQDPVAFIRRYGKRIHQIHIKDIADLSNYETTTELGKGVVDLPGVIAAAKEIGCLWLTYEQDYSADPFRSAEESLKYLRKIC
ncbi:MAG: sugar phosphate isomerase/epimerase [Lentisphaeria bacterium]|nr:sugar phosphate isomerase/epimerase [Lentisphaeria bacterium]